MPPKRKTKSTGKRGPRQKKMPHFLSRDEPQDGNVSDSKAAGRGGGKRAKTSVETWTEELQRLEARAGNNDDFGEADAGTVDSTEILQDLELSDFQALSNYANHATNVIRRAAARATLGCKLAEAHLLNAFDWHRKHLFTSGIRWRRSRFWIFKYYVSQLIPLLKEFCLAHKRSLESSSGSGSGNGSRSASLDEDVPASMQDMEVTPTDEVFASDTYNMNCHWKGKPLVSSSSSSSLTSSTCSTSLTSSSLSSSSRHLYKDWLPRTFRGYELVRDLQTARLDGFATAGFRLNRRQLLKELQIGDVKDLLLCLLELENEARNVKHKHTDLWYAKTRPSWKSAKILERERAERRKVRATDRNLSKPKNRDPWRGQLVPSVPQVVSKKQEVDIVDDSDTDDSATDSDNDSCNGFTSSSDDMSSGDDEDARENGKEDQDTDDIGAFQNPRQRVPLVHSDRVLHQREKLKFPANLSNINTLYSEPGYKFYSAQVDGRWWQPQDDDADEEEKEEKEEKEGKEGKEGKERRDDGAGGVEGKRLEEPENKQEIGGGAPKVEIELIRNTTSLNFPEVLDNCTQYIEYWRRSYSRRFHFSDIEAGWEQKVAAMFGRVVDHLDWFMGSVVNPRFNGIQLTTSMTLPEYTRLTAEALFLYPSNYTVLQTTWDNYISMFSTIQALLTASMEGIDDAPPLFEESWDGLARLRGYITNQYNCLLSCMVHSATSRMRDIPQLATKFQFENVLGAELPCLAVEVQPSQEVLTQDQEKLERRLLALLRKDGYRRAESTVDRQEGFLEPQTRFCAYSSKLRKTLFYIPTYGETEFRERLTYLCGRGVHGDKWLSIFKLRQHAIHIQKNLLTDPKFLPCVTDRYVFSFSEGIFDMFTGKYIPYTMVEALSRRSVLSIEEHAKENCRVFLKRRAKRILANSKHASSDELYKTAHQDITSEAVETEIEKFLHSDSGFGFGFGVSGGGGVRRSAVSVGIEVSDRSAYPMTRTCSRSVLRRANGTYDLHPSHSDQGRRRDVTLKEQTFGTVNSFDQDMNYYNLHLTLNLSEGSVLNLPMFALFQLFYAQKFPESVIIAILMLDGRQYHALGLDNWQIMKWILGLGQSGKSTYLNYIASAYQNDDIGRLAEKMEEQFGFQNLLGKKIIVGTDINRKFNLNNSMWNMAVSKEAFSVAVKNRKADQNGLLGHWCIGGNNFPEWDNQQGQTDRRIAMVLFRFRIPDSDAELTRRLHNFERGCFLLCTTILYRWYLAKYGHKMIWTFLPHYFHGTKKFVIGSTNTLYRFMKSSEVVLHEKVLKKLDEDLYNDSSLDLKGAKSTQQFRHMRRHPKGSKLSHTTPTTESADQVALTQRYGCPLHYFEDCYKSWCKSNKFDSVSWKIDVCKSVFDMLGVSMYRFTGDWPTATGGLSVHFEHKMFVFGCTLKNVHLLLKKQKEDEDEAAMASGMPASRPPVPPVPAPPPPPPPRDEEVKQQIVTT